MAIQEIAVPEIGGAEEVEVIEICVQPGDSIVAEASLIVLESDKASMEVPSPTGGKVVEVKLKTGDKVSAGSPILTLEVEGEPAAASASPSPTEAEEPAAEVTAPATADADAVAPAAPEQSRTERIAVPDIGGGDAVDVIEVTVAEGDQLTEGDSMVVLESDKASMEVPAPKTGRVMRVLIKVGDKVSKGTEILELEVSDAPSSKQEDAKLEGAISQQPGPEAARPSTPASSAAAPQAQASLQSPSQPATGAVSAAAGDVYAGPAVRRLAREMGIDLTRVSGSGPKGRVQKDDVKTFVKDLMSSRGSVGGSLPKIPEVDFSAFGPVDIQPVTKLHKLTAANMQRNWLNLPHVTQFDEADVTELEAFRSSLKAEAEQQGARATPLPFLLKACAAALKAHPKFNASLINDGEDLALKQYVHIAIAVDTPAGLVVPVIRDVDRKSIWELARESAELAERAKARKLKPDEMQGGCFSISSLGSIGGQGFTPIINAPEVAILGVSRLATKPVWDGKEFAPRKMLPLSLSYDHRVINGADAGRFFTYLNGLLADVRRLLL